MQTALMVGQVVKVVDTSQFQRVVKIGAVVEIRTFEAGMYVRVLNWPIWVPVDQVRPLGVN